MPPKPGCTVASTHRRLAIEIHSPDIPTCLKPTSERAAELDRLGDAIAELSAHLEAATARLLDLIREFDARGGWGNGFRSCAHWLSWRIGLDLGAAREKVRVARALGTLPLMAQALARGGVVVRQGPGPDPRRHSGDRSAAARVGRAGTASHVERIVRGWRCVDRKAEARETKRHQRRSRLPSAPVGHALQAPTLSAMFRAPDQPERSRMAIAIRVEHIGLAAEA